MENEKYARFTVETSGQEKIVIEFPYTDISVADVCQAFHTIMVGMTFTDDSAGEMLASYLEVHYGSKYNIVSING